MIWINLIWINLIWITLVQMFQYLLRLDRLLFFSVSMKNQLLSQNSLGEKNTENKNVQHDE